MFKLAYLELNLGELTVAQRGMDRLSGYTVWLPPMFTKML
jgi:hypothetical protein